MQIPKPVLLYARLCRGYSFHRPRISLIFGSERTAQFCGKLNFTHNTLPRSEDIFISPLFFLSEGDVFD